MPTLQTFFSIFKKDALEKLHLKKKYALNSTLPQQRHHGGLCGPRANRRRSARNCDEGNNFIQSFYGIEPTNSAKIKNNRKFVLSFLMLISRENGNLMIILSKLGKKTHTPGTEFRGITTLKSCVSVMKTIHNSLAPFQFV